MKEYKNASPQFSDTIRIVETTDSNHADNINAGVVQTFQNTLYNRENIKELTEKATELESDYNKLTENAAALANNITEIEKELTDSTAALQNSIAETQRNITQSAATLAGVVLTKTLNAGATSLVFTNAAITTDSTIDLYTSKYGVSPSEATVGAGTITLTFEPQSATVNVKVVVK